MFGFLKKKIAEIAESISGKVKEKSDEIQARPADQQIQPEEIMEGRQFTEIPSTEHAEAQTEEVKKETSEKPIEAHGQESGFLAQKTEPVNHYIETESEREAGPDTRIETENYPELDRKEESVPTFFEDAEKKLELMEEEIKEEEEPVKIEPKVQIEDEPVEIRPIIEAERQSESREEKKSFFHKLTEKVVKKVTEKRLSDEDVSPMLQDLETSLIEADVAVEVVEKIKNDLKEALVGSEIKRGKEKEVVVQSLRRSLMDILDVPGVDFGSLVAKKKPVLIAFWGFNGAGKTTSLAKTATWLKERGYSCVMAAADTFRAGAEEQLDIHAERIGVKSIKHKYGADPAAVIFDAVEHAKAKGVDFVLADTAGRAHTNTNLMDQMKKIVRVNKPDLKILVIDSLTGNDALLQARAYGDIGVDAIIFTKVDVNEKGGAILSVTHELKKPIVFLGMGQDYKNFEEFDAKKFVDKLLG